MNEQTYTVTIRVLARAAITVKAKSASEAKKIAEEDFYAFDCGNLTDIDWDAYHAEDEQGNREYFE